ncbi:TlpA disulfide reductase family protein [Luteimonas sp. RD2P54]|uniref:TlpA disulfide reductase family protein n=1 Tax=Luteimonas endophytica TaxID=3042023 RepID=A0ABT6JFG0_9GAMM|nr:TlpA disulfide reductase family protein [Luteimonas endophytica]MDH5824908.1 TlpA disulfide reductase family protein [Luteimonas endophytica]
MRGSTKVVLVAVTAGALGVAASLLTTGPGPLLRTEPGQRLAQRVLQADAPAPPAGVAVAERGGAVPAFEVAALDGGRFVLPDDFAGRPLLVNVWASWCGPCIEEMPELDRYARAQGADGTRVLGIALDEADAVRGFLERVPVSYPLAIDAPGNADAGVRLGNPRGVLPYSVLVSADGRVLKQRIGPFAHGEIDAWARP